MPHPTHDSAPVLQAAQQHERAQRARQARHLKWWQRAAVAVALFPAAVEPDFSVATHGQIAHIAAAVVYCDAFDCC